MVDEQPGGLVGGGPLLHLLGVVGHGLEAVSEVVEQQLVGAVAVGVDHLGGAVVIDPGPGIVPGRQGQRRKGQGQQSASYHPSGQPPGRVNLFALVDAPGAVGAEGGCIRQLCSAVGTGFLLAHDSASIRYMTSLYRLAGLTWVHRWITRPSRPSASLLEGCWPVSSTFISTPRE